MRTPKDYQEHIKHNEITDKMLSDCAYSMNTCAKNMRDNQRDYYARRLFGYYDYYNQEHKYCEKKKYYYSMKKILLSPIKPTCLHTAITQSPYGSSKDLYLVTEVGGRCFHQPLNEGEEEKYKDLEIKDIGRLETYGSDTNELISVQFAQKDEELKHTITIQLKHAPTIKVVGKYNRTSQQCESDKCMSITEVVVADKNRNIIKNLLPPIASHFLHKILLDAIEINLLIRY